MTCTTFRCCLDGTMSSDGFKRRQAPHGLYMHFFKAAGRQNVARTLNWIEILRKDKHIHMTEASTHFRDSDLRSRHNETVMYGAQEYEPTIRRDLSAPNFPLT